jgi:hypothetical protein
MDPFLGFLHHRLSVAAPAGHPAYPYAAVVMMNQRLKQRALILHLMHQMMGQELVD